MPTKSPKFGFQNILSQYNSVFLRISIAVFKQANALVLDFLFPSFRANASRYTKLPAALLFIAANDCSAQM